MKRLSPFRRLATPGYLLGATFFLLSGLSMTSATLAAERQLRVPAKVGHSDATSLVFRVEVPSRTLNVSGALTDAVRINIPGFALIGQAGSPAIPSRRFLVALPPNGTYSLTYRVLEREDLGTIQLEPKPFLEAGDGGGELGRVMLERYAIEPQQYRSYVDPPLVESLDPVYLRRNRVLPVRVNPVRYDPTTGRAALVTAVEIEVRFRTGAAPSAFVSESPMWEGLLSRAVVNAGQARKWRVPRPARPSTALTSSLAALSDRLVRLEVRSTGIHRVRALTLIQGGFPSGVAIADLHLFQRTYDDDNLVAGIQDVAFYVAEAPGGTPGVFELDDQLIFYGRDLFDDAAQGDRIKKYADYNLYWLGDDGGPSMSTRPTTAGFITADTSSAFYSRRQRFEEDVVFNEFTHPSSGNDFNVFNWGFESMIDAPFPMPALKPGSMVHLRVALRGRLYKAPRISTLRINNSIGTTNLTTSFSLPNRDRRYYETDVAATAFVGGENRFQATSTRSAIDMHLNWVEATYEALFQARNNMLRFNTFSMSGDTSVTVTGLQSTDHYLFDITDPSLPVLVDISGRFTDVGDNFAMSFRDDADANRDYIVVPQNGMIALAASDITRDTPSTIIGGSAESGVDVLVVAHGSFVSGMQDWVTYRRAQGYRVLMVDVEDAYDEFNNGVPGTRGVSRFIRHFYEYGGAGTVLLVGDASEDARGLHDDSPPNFVPTFSHAEHIGVLLEDEVVTTDKLYVKLPDPGGFVDNEPDMALGRIPVGTQGELVAVLFKIFQYERPQATETWRRRVIVVSDDEFSTGSSGSLGGGFELCEKGAERGFQSSQELVAAKFGNAPGGFDVVEVHLHDQLEAAGSYPPRPPSGAWCWSQGAAIPAARSVATPYLMAELAKGACVVTIQAHMNRSQVGHEMFFTTFSGNVTGTGTGYDHLNIANTGRPFVLFALGCHFSDYALHREQALGRTNANRPNGDSFAEQLLFANNKGAVGVIGSAGYEYLNETNQYMQMTTSVWLYEAPYENIIAQTQGQWKLGEITYLAEVAIPQVGPIERYHTLGDPLLRIEAGPPAFDVTVNGAPIENGDAIKSAGSDTVEVVALIADENAIQDFTLTIANVPMRDSLTVEKIGDASVPNGRRYRVSFRHVLRAEGYSIVLGALQAPDTSGAYGIDARFEMVVPADVSLAVNGRPIREGDIVAAKGNYVVDLAFAVELTATDISARIDDVPQTDVELSTIVPDDSTGWRLRFNAELAEGEHTLLVSLGVIDLTPITFYVKSETGLRNVINYPNPFVDDTYFFFTNDVQISDGTVDVYTTSGRRIRSLVVPPGAMSPGENTVYWDGLDGAGDEIANGVYLYIIKVRQNGEWNTFRGKLARMH